jgi:hypothetical protein
MAQRARYFLGRLQGLQATSPDVAARQRTLLRMLVEATLIEEFGQAVVNEAAFQSVIDGVTQALQDDEACQEDLRLIAAVLGG